MLSWKAILPLIAIALSCLYALLNSNEDTEAIKEKILLAWESLIKEPEKKFTRISIGINANADLIVPGIQLMNFLGLKPGRPTDHLVINTPEQLQETFSYYLARGAAVERPYRNAHTYRDIVNRAASLLNASWYIGGNAALMAQNIVTGFDDVEVELVGPVGQHLQQLLNRAIVTPFSALTDEDEIHLILEYAVGDKWGRARAPIANRLITSYDEANGRVASLETFFSSVPDFAPDLVVCTGMHMLESQHPTVWAERIPVLLQGLKELPPCLPVHMELASMVNTGFISQLLTKTLLYVTSLGLNEQELALMTQALGGPHHDVIWRGQPKISKVADIMAWILRMFGRSAARPWSKLTRVHFHCLSFHLIATAPGHWGNMEAAVAAGARVAGLKACGVLIGNSRQFDLMIPRTFKLSTGLPLVNFDPDRPVSSWTVAEGWEFVFSPVLVCQNPLKTVGLGDAISAVGLLYSHFTQS